MITVPTLLVDEEKCRGNIDRMVAKARKNRLEFRPHFKTHQSHEIGRWFREAGVTKITCSSFSMASYFAADGWDDITVAFPVNVLEIETINQLASQINLNILVESQETVELLNSQLKSEVGVSIKIDIGTHRTGMNACDFDAIQKVIDSIDEAEQMNFIGFLAHAGHTYACRGKQDILETHEVCLGLLAALKDRFPNAFISYGDTPSCSVAESFGSTDELRPGNFCFYDLMQWQIGSCAMEEVSVAMACPIVAKHPERNEVVIYGGGVHFSKDFIEVEGKRVFGMAVENVAEKWGELLPEIVLVRVSQEHGVLRGPVEWIDQLKIGEVVKVIPVHSCMTMDLLRSFKAV